MLKKYLFADAVDFAKAYNNTTARYIEVIDNTTYRNMVLFHNKSFDTILFKLNPFGQLLFEYYIATYTDINRISNQTYLDILNGWLKNDRLVKTYEQMPAYTSIW